MLIRFTTLATDSDSGHTSGILVSAHDLRDNGELTVNEHSELRVSLVWFNENLTVPGILKSKEHRRAISWFKPAAVEAIQRMWHLKGILELHGLYIEVLRTSDPGSIVYEDEWQIIAKPRKGQCF